MSYLFSFSYSVKIMASQKDLTTYGCCATKALMCLCVFELCPMLCGPMDCSQPDSSVLGILQAGILQGVAIRFSRGSSSSGIEPLSLASQADSLPAEPSGKSPSLSDQLSNMPLGL